MDILQTTDLKKYYGKGDTMVKALDGVSLCVEQGSFVSVVGTSGSGKSTLLHMLGGLDRPTEGTVTVDGRDISRLKDEELTIFRRRKIGFVFQSYNLVPVLNVYENIILPVELDGNQPDQVYVEEIIKILGLAEKKYKLPSQLSGGQQQRVAIARALASDAQVILADEPTGNLDEDTAAEITAILKDSAHKSGKCVVIVTHSNELAKEADVVFRLRKGDLQISDASEIEPERKRK